MSPPTHAQHQHHNEPPVVRVVPRSPLTRAEFTVTILIALNRSYSAIARELNVKVSTVAEHAKNASRKLPGDLPSKTRIMAWARGATLDVLEGRSLRYEVMIASERSSN